MKQEIADLLNGYPASYASGHLVYVANRLNALQKQVLIDRIAVLARCIPKALPDGRKVQLLYAMLTECITYDCSENEVRFTYIGALSGRAVCMGIAELFRALCGAVGVECITVIGVAGQDLSDNEGHAWNMVWLADQSCPGWYHVDVTWDLSRAGSRQYKYFLKSDSYMNQQLHYWLPDRYPECTRDADEYPEIPRKVVNQLCQIFQKQQA